MTVSVKYQRALVIQRTAYGDVLVFLACLYVEERRVDSELRRAVRVDETTLAGRG